MESAQDARHIEPQSEVLSGLVLTEERVATAVKRLGGEPRPIVGYNQGEHPRIDHHVERHDRRCVHASIAQQVVEHLLHQGKIDGEKRGGTTACRGFEGGFRRAARFGRGRPVRLGHGRQVQPQAAAAHGHHLGHMSAQLLAKVVERKSLALDGTVLQLAETAHRSRISLETCDLGGKRVERILIQRVAAAQPHLGHLDRSLEHGDGRAQVVRERRVQTTARFGRAP